MAAERAGNGPCRRSLFTLSEAGGLLPVIALAALVFLTGLGRLPLFGRDEALYAEAAREMHATGDWITPRVNGAFFFEKPPLLYWLDGLAYSALGPTPLAARLPAALLGILTVGMTAATASRVWGRRAGLLAGLTLIACPLVAMIARMGLMDMPLTFLITAAMLVYARWRRAGGPLWGLAFGGLTGLALLLKGLAGGLAPAIAVVHALMYRRRGAPLCAPVLSTALAVIATSLVSAPWFLLMLSHHGDRFISDFVVQQHFARIARPMQGHGGMIFTYPALIAFAFFPWVAFLPAAFRKSPHDGEERSFWRSLSLVWFLMVLLPFSLVRTKLPGYILPLFPPMAMLVAAELDRRIVRPGRAPWIAVIAGGATLAAAFSLLPLRAATLGARHDAANAAYLLVLPGALWVGGYIAGAIGGAEALRGHPRAGLAFMAVGQLVVLGALLAGILPVLSPYQGGGPAHLALLAQRELPGRPIVLYETRPETVAFVLQRNVPVYSHNEKAELIAALQREPTALIAPLKEREFWQALPRHRLWRRGLEVLMDVPSPDGADPANRRQPAG